MDEKKVVLRKKKALWVAPEGIFGASESTNSSLDSSI